MSETPPVESPLRSRLFRHFVTLAAGDVSTRVLLALGWIVLARRLGADVLGLVEFSIGVLAYFQLAAHAGLDWTGMRRIARGDAVDVTVGELVGLRLVLAAAGLVLLLVVAAALPQPKVGGLLASYGLLLFTAAFNLRWVFLAEERGRAVAAVGTLAQLAFLTTVVVFVGGPEHVGRLPWLQLACELAAVGGLALLLARKGLRPKWSAARWPEALREALPIAGTQLIGQILYNVDVVLLGFLGHLGRVGIYGAAYRVVLLLQVVPAAYFTAIFPTLVRGYESPARRGESAPTERTLYFAIAATAPVALIVFDRADWIVTLLYGDSFTTAGGVLRVLVWSFPIVAARALFRQLLVAAHQERLHFLLSLVAAVLNVALNLALIPRFHVFGAASATIASEATLLALVAGACSRILGASAIARPAAGPVISAAAMAVALGAGPASPPARISAALTVYLLALLASWRLWGCPR